MSSPESEDNLEAFHEKLQEMVIQQSSRILNNDIYTKSLLSSLPVALISTDKKGRIQVVNRAAEEMLQTTLQSVKGSSLSDLFSRSPAIAEIIGQAGDQQSLVSADSLDLILTENQKKVVNVHVQPFHDEEDIQVGALLAMEDQTYISFLRDSFKQHALTPPDGEIVAHSPKMKKVVKLLSEMGKNDEPVLISGASGTGKTFLSAKLHKSRELDPQAPFIMLDCRQLNGAEARETLFGSNENVGDDKHSIRFRSLHDYGTIHLAEGGTLVLLNIDALNLECLDAVNDYIEQVAAESSTLPKCRIVATTEADPKKLSEQEEVSKGLLARLRKNHIAVPVLRDRRKDILALARLFIPDQEGSATKTLSKGAENGLLSKEYNQNNAKELRDAIELAVLVTDGDDIRSEHIFTGPMEEAAGYEADLTDFALVRFLYQDRTLKVLRGGVLAFFAALIGLTLFFPDRVAGVFSNHLVWGTWWVGLVVTFLVLGRVWCTVCPLSTAGLIASRFWSLAKPPPAFIKKYSPFLIAIGFGLILWAEYVFHMTTHPEATGVLLVALIASAVFFALFFARETWCRYLCPLGNFGGLFSLGATLFVRANPKVCSSKCTTHECHKGSATQAGCPVFHHPLYARNAHVCKMCCNCLKSCPHGSARLYLRPPLIRMWKQLDFGETMGYLALVLFFITPFLLASERIPFFMSEAIFTISVLASFGLAAICHYALPRVLFGDHEQKSLHTNRQTQVLLLVVWGAFAAFQFGHLPGLDELFVVSGEQGLLHSFLPEHGLSLRALVQLGAIWFGGGLALVVLINIWVQTRRSKVTLPRRSWYFAFAICLFYPLLSSWFVL